MADGAVVTVVLGRFEPLVSGGLAHALATDASVHVLACGLDERALELAVVRERPRVAIVGEAVCYGLLARLKSKPAPPGLLVLAQEFTSLSETAVRAAGAAYLALSAATTPKILSTVHAQARGELIGREPLSLTPRQTQVFGYLSKDTPYSAIAFELDVSVATVHTHARAVFRAFGVKNRRELIGKILPDRPPSVGV